MAQLSDDCFAFGGKLLSLQEAVRIVTTGTPCVQDVEQADLCACDGRVLASDVLAPCDLPPFDNAAVDGYAVRLDDVSEAALPVLGRYAAGQAGAALLTGSASRIFTGAVLPSGADTVFMQEDVRLDADGRVQLPGGLRRGANTRRRGEDVAHGACALPRGRRLRPQDLALAAALGLRSLPVRRAPRVVVFSTGNEIVEPGQPLAAAQRYDANRVLLAALLRRAGAQVADAGILPDQPQAVAAALLAAARGHDLILTSGGVSTGEEDHVRAAVEAVGTLAFWRLAIKPGRPLAMGQVGAAQFVGLPGNPVAAFVTFARLVRPLLAALGGGTHAPVALRVTSAFDYRKKAGRREYVRVRLLPGPAGLPQAQKHPVEGAGILTSLTETDGLAELDEDVTTVRPGDSVGYLPYELLT